jgi:uncharacterized Zn finger protein
MAGYRKTQRGKALVPGERKHLSNDVAKQSAARVNAIISQALDLIVKDARDPAKRLCDEYYKAPIPFIEWLDKRANGGQTGAASGAAIMLNLAFAAAPAPAPDIKTIEGETIEAGVQSGSDDSQAIDW